LRCAAALAREDPGFNEVIMDAPQLHTQLPGRRQRGFPGRPKGL